MSESVSEGEDSDDAADSISVGGVLDALTPLLEQMDSGEGFVVKHGRRSEVGRPVDPDVVEVHVRLAPPRHPKEVDMAMGMLQGHGYTVQKRKRGFPTSYVRIILRVSDESRGSGNKLKGENDNSNNGEQTSILDEM